MLVWFWTATAGEHRQLVALGEVPQTIPDPIPESVRSGPRVPLPHRNYLLYSGPVEAAMASVHLADRGQIPNLWWPDDKAWFVASEIDLAWTYVGGSVGMVEALVADGRIEALPVEATDVYWFVEVSVTGDGGRGCKRASDERNDDNQHISRVSECLVSSSETTEIRRTEGQQGLPGRKWLWGPHRFVLTILRRFARVSRFNSPVKSSNWSAGEKGSVVGQS